MAGSNSGPIGFDTETGVITITIGEDSLSFVEFVYVEMSGGRRLLDGCCWLAFIYEKSNLFLTHDI